MRRFDLSSVPEATEFPKVTPGGYICKIRNAIDMQDKEYIKLEYDIAEGNLKGYYSKLYESKGFWGASFVKSYKDTAKPFFKAFITSVERSNNSYQWDFDENKLRGTFVGLVLGEEEYKGNDGTSKKRLYVAQVHSIDKIRKGDFVLPEFRSRTEKSLKRNTATDGFYPIDDSTEDDDLPF